MPVRLVNLEGGALEGPGSSPGDAARLFAYNDLLQQGYIWETNCDEKDIPDYKTRREALGLEVFVHNKAFTKDGNLWVGKKAILTRKRK